MTLLITGASGFVGRHLVELLRAGVEWMDLPIISGGRKQFDLTDPASLRLLNDLKVEVVIHLASVTPSHVRSECDYLNTNVTGTFNLLNSLNRKYLKKIILLSSVSVYKVNTDKPTRFIEDNCEITNPVEAEGSFCVTSYGISKYLQELFIRTYCGKSIEYLIFRASSIYGSGMPITALLPVFQQKSKNNDDLEISVKNYSQNFIYVGDVVKLIGKGIANNSGIYNLFSNETIGIEDLAELIVRVNQSLSKIVRNYRTEVMFEKIYDNTKLLRDFNNCTFTTLEEGINCL